MPISPKELEVHVAKLFNESAVFAEIDEKLIDGATNFGPQTILIDKNLSAWEFNIIRTAYHKVGWLEVTMWYPNQRDYFSGTYLKFTP